MPARGRALQILGALIALGALLRFATLGARSLWVDEAVTAEQVRLSFGGMLSGLTVREISGPPLYFLLAWPWARLFGESEVALRSLPALMGTLTIPVAYAAARELATVRAGLVSAALAAVCPLVVWQSQDARPYALLVLLGGVSFLFFVRALRTGESRELAGWAIASAATVTCHYYGVFIVGAEAAWLLYASPDRRRVLWAISGLAAVGVALAPLIAKQQQIGLAFWVEDLSLGSRVAQLPAQFLVGYQPPFQIAASVLAALLALIPVWLLVRRGGPADRRTAGMAAAIAGAALVLPTLLAVVGPDYVLTRYLSAAWVPAVAVAGVGFAVPGAGRLGAAGLVALLALFVAVDLGSAWKPKFDREDWRGASRALGPPQDDRAIVVSRSSADFPFRYYLPSARRRGSGWARLRRIDVVGVPPRFRKIGQEPRPPRPRAVPPPAPGFSLAARRDDEYFTLLTFRAPDPRRVWLPSLEKASLRGRAVILLDGG